MKERLPSGSIYFFIFVVGILLWLTVIPLGQMVISSFRSGHPAAPGPFHGKAGYKEFITSYVAAFPDGKITVDDQIAEGDIVASRWTARGTNTGELMGMPATGKEVTVSGIAYTRIVDGKVRESWNSWDTLSMLQQLGVVPQVAAAQS